MTIIEDECERLNQMFEAKSSELMGSVDVWLEDVEDDIQSFIDEVNEAEFSESSKDWLRSEIRGRCD